MGALVLYTVFKNKLGAGAGTSTAQDLSGLGTDASGNRVVYVPTQTSFSTSNIGADYSNDPNLQTISNSPVVSNSPLTVTKNVAPPPVIITKPSPPPPVVVPTTPPPPNGGGTPTGGTPPVKAPPPPPTKKWQIFWNYPYTVGPGDTLSKIAANITDAAHKAGMPNNMAITWQMIYNYNKAVIDATAKAHGNPIPGGPQNNIFPGEKIWLAGWTYA
jgi:hypothetical protein